MEPKSFAEGTQCKLCWKTSERLLPKPLPAVSAFESSDPLPTNPSNITAGFSGSHVFSGSTTQWTSIVTSASNSQGKRLYWAFPELSSSTPCFRYASLLILSGKRVLKRTSSLSPDMKEDIWGALWAVERGVSDHWPWLRSKSITPHTAILTPDYVSILFPGKWIGYNFYTWF